MKKGTSFSKTRFRIGQIKNVFKQIFQSKRGTFGIIILITASIIALMAPVIAPHDPVRDTDLAGTYCAPIWYPKVFGGPYSENMYLIEDPLFDTPIELEKWHSPPDGSIQISWTNIVGYSKNLKGETYNNPGALLINLTNPASENLEVIFSNSFVYNLSLIHI